MKKNILTIGIIVLFLTIATIRTASAGRDQDPAIEDIIITTSEQHLLLFANVANSFTPEMIAGARNGIPITFTFHIELEKIRNNWFDTTLLEKTLTHTLTFDSLKEEFHVTFSNKNRREKTNSLAKAKQLMTELSGVALIERSLLIPDAPYACHIKATLAENTLPLGMHYIVPFASLWNFETDWRTIEFRY